MTFDITLEPDAEEVVIVLDSASVLKANKGLQPKEVKLCKAFRALEEEDEKLYRVLRSFAINLLSLE